jgi:DNA repair exonuclease SbcCD ATPase subunit
MMDNETLHVLIGHLRELKAGQEELKAEMNAGQEELSTEMNAVYAGQRDLKAEMNAVYAGQEELKTYISALETKTNAGQEELKQEINAFQQRIRNIEVGQAEFEERVTCTVDTQLKNMSSMVEQQTRNLREDLSRKIEATRQDFETQLAALEARARMREVTRVPTARPPTPPEGRRSERPVCWWCGQPGRLQKYCRQRLPEEMGRDPRTRRGVSEPSITPPRFIVKVLAE